VDVVLTDLLMPGTSGALLIRAVREWIPHPPRIIAMTGADHTERESVVLAAVAEGADTILVKPFGLKQLLDVIRKKATPAQHIPF
jgi:CheY-like chemotaxis protein